MAEKRDYYAEFRESVDADYGIEEQVNKEDAARKKWQKEHPNEKYPPDRNYTAHATDPFSTDLLGPRPEGD
ncbi:hypothetical protein [Streptomyces noursei]|uniref:hypothetical protein n=1 Tax=Streptomyces noursei TaxID=1971 RepID=UPI0030EFE3E8